MLRATVCTPRNIHWGCWVIVDGDIGSGAMAVAKVEFTAIAVWDMHRFIFTVYGIDRGYLTLQFALFRITIEVVVELISVKHYLDCHLFWWLRIS